MANEEAKKQPEGKPPKIKGKFKLILLLLAVGLAMPFMLGMVLLLLAGFIPTYVAFATDNDPEKSGAASVGAMNLAGIVPFLIDLWTKGQTPGNAFRILSEMNTWLVILGAAAIGQLIVYAVPQAIATLSQTHAEARIKALRKNLDMLKESWGPEVSTTKPVDKIMQG
jgi:hypothetical protein